MPLDLEVIVLSICAILYLANICVFPLPSVAVISSLVSHLPGSLLDIIINVPYFLLATHKALSRNRVSTSTSTVTTSLELPPAPAPAPAASPAPTPPEAPAAVVKETVGVDSPPSSEHEREASENGSEADVESNDGAGVGESWVSLQPQTTATA